MVKKIVLFVFLFTTTLSTSFAQGKKQVAVPKSDTARVLYSEVRDIESVKEKISDLKAKNPVDPIRATSLKSIANEANNSFEEIDADEDNETDIPADELYSFLWTSESFNPYNVKIEDLPDSTVIDCREFVFPLTSSNRVTSYFGPRRSRYHYGTDLGLKVGDSIVAAFSGTVRIVNYQRRGFGNYIVIRHRNGLESVYAHLSKSLVKENQQVKAGELIGLGGNTGRSTGPHLHFELRFLGNAFNTEKLIDYGSRNHISDAYCITKNETFKYKKDMERLKARNASKRYHKVKGGETLSHIARKYGTSVSQLCKLNRINRTSTLRIGRSIRYR